MTKLYYVPRTRSSRPRWLLEELEVPYELVRLNPAAGETKTEAHTARHPLQHVPVLETEDGTVFESSAIVLHLAEKHGVGRVLPPAGTHARALVYQWLFYLMTELEPQLVAYNVQKVAKKTPESPEAMEALKRIATALAPLEALLGRQAHIAGAEFSVVDVVGGALLAWGNRHGVVAPGSALAGYVERMTSRPAYRRAIAD